MSCFASLVFRRRESPQRSRYPIMIRCSLCTEDQALRRLNTVSGLQETLAYFDVGSVLDLARSSDGGMVALCGQNGSIKVWKQRDFAMTALLGADGPIAQLGFDSNNDLLAITSTGKSGSGAIRMENCFGNSRCSNSRLYDRQLDS